MANLSNINNKLIVTDGGNLLVNATANLATYGGITIDNFSDPSIAMKTTGTSGWLWTQYITSTGTNNYSMGVNQTSPSYWCVKAGAGMDSPHLVVNSSGNVGIGDISPQGKLEVNNRNTATGAALFIKGGEDDLSPIAGQYTGLAFGYGGGDIYNNASILWEFTNTAANGKLHFAVNPTGGDGTANLSDSKMTILDSGNVGIGTIAPDAKLDISNVAGGTYALEISTPERDRALFFYNSASVSDAGYLGIKRGSVDALNHRFATSGNSAVCIGIGNFGIGTDSPSRKLVVAQSDVTEPSGIDANTSILIKNNTWSGIQMISTEATGNFITFGDNANGFAGRIQYSHATNAMQFETVGAERMRIDDSGNVGFGVTGPNALLSTADTNAYTQEWTFAKGYRHFTTYPAGSTGNYNISTKISFNNLRGLCVDYYESGHLYNNGAAYYFRHTRFYIMMEGSTLRINDAVLIQNTGNRTDAIVNAPAVTSNASLECLITSTIKSGFTHYVSADMVGSGFNSIVSIS